MGTLHLVRHGQASFGEADYDRLSELGARQCRRLGEHWREHGMRFDAVIRGSLRRHEQSLHALQQGLGQAVDAVVDPALDEYDSAAVVRAIHPQPLPPARTPEAVRHHFRLLRQGLAAWMQAHTAPEGMPAYADFALGIARVLERVRREHEGQVLIVSSGGPISTAVGLVLEMPPVATIELNMRIRNSAVTELSFNPKRHALHTFNHLPHLAATDDAASITYT